MGYEVRGASGAARALELLAEAPARRGPLRRAHARHGRAHAAQISRERFPLMKIVLMTAFGSVDDAVEAMRAGAYTYVTKPFKVDEIAAVLRNAAREVALGREVEGLQAAVRGRWSADALLGSSPAMAAVRHALREAAQVTATVLVTGKSGTGKELAARAIHFEGPRAAGPFVPVNCARDPRVALRVDALRASPGSLHRRREPDRPRRAVVGRHALPRRGGGDPALAAAEAPARPAGLGAHAARRATA